MQTIAVIEDNIITGDMISEILLEEGFQVIRAYSGTEALYLLTQRRPDLILLDLVLPGLDGEEVLEHVQGIPVIVLSSKTEVENKIALLNEGACDYITKPFHRKELIARILVHLRRANTSEDSAILSVGDLTLDSLSLKLSTQLRCVRLTKTECTILKLLMTNSRYTVSKDFLLDRISFEIPDCTEKSLKQHVYNLRKKMTGLHSTVFIETVRSVGFKLTKAAEEAADPIA